jgi:hypothetical protein
MVEVLSVPFVNYVLASSDQFLLKEYSEKIKAGVDEEIINSLDIEYNLPGTGRNSAAYSYALLLRSYKRYY